MKIILTLIISVLIYAGDFNTLKTEYFTGCDKVLNSTEYSVCYSYKDKAMTSSYSLLTNKVKDVNIKKRRPFKVDKRIPKQYRTSTKDYTKTGFDRGHTAVSDASADYSISTLKDSYLMSNITLQRPITNRRSWLRVEKYGRLLAVKYGYVKVLTIVMYKIVPEKVNGISIPSAYIRVIKHKNVQKCFYVPNDNISYYLKQSEFNCKYLN